MKIYSEDMIVPTLEKFYTTNNNSSFLLGTDYYLTFASATPVVTGLIPQNFSRMLSMTLVLLAMATGGDDDRTLVFTAAGVGEDREVKQDGVVVTANVLANGPIEYIDYTSIDPGVEAGDSFGLYLESDGGIVNSSIGAVLKYEPLRPVQ